MKPCCVDNINSSPDTSSCSMVLRSACSHGRSHKSLLTTDVTKQESTQRKRKSLKDSNRKISKSVTVSSSENSLNTNSFKQSSEFVSSLEKLSLKSSKTFSILKEHLFSQLHFSENQKCEFADLHQEDFGYIKKLDFSETSSPITPLYLNTHNGSTKLSSEFQSSIERDYNYNTTNMSRTRRLNRNSLRALSGSETEDDVSFSSNRIRLKRNKKSDAFSGLSTDEAISSESHSDIYVSSNHNNVSRNISATITSNSTLTTADYLSNNMPTGFSESYQSNSTVNSSQMNMSAIQYSSTLDRFRWLLWSYIYLKIIKIVNFDVWLLSRLGRRRRVVTVLLLPFLLYLLYCLLGSCNEFASKSFDVFSSSVSTFASHVYSLFSRSSQKSEEVEAVESSFYLSPSFALSAFWGIPSFLSNIFAPVKTTSYTSETTSDSVDSRIKSDNFIMKQEIEILTVKTLDAKFNELVRKIQASQDVKAEAVNTLQKEISDLRLQFKSLFSSVQQLEKNIQHTDKEKGALFGSLNTKMKDFEEKLSFLGDLKKCCDEKWTAADFMASIEKHLITAFKNVMSGDKNADSPYYFFHQWLNSKFIDSSKLSTELKAAFAKLKTEKSSDLNLDPNSMNIVKSFVEQYVDTLKINLASASSTKTTHDNSLTHQDMRKIVKEALLLYDADKTGKVDYALESGGGSILSTRCSESYIEKNGRFTVLGVPLWSGENSPRTAIQPDVQPGKCWAFKGSQGYLVIQLSYTVYPTGFTLEHIPVSLSPSGSIDSAPKEFSVWGLSSEKDFDGVLLGKYIFEIDGDPLQYFEVQNFTSIPFSLVELKIHSNHGNLEYTCLYRFRVHGTRA